MKKLFTLLLAMVGAGSSLFAQTTSGGPDSYGYTWKSSADAVSPPTYRWIDVAAPNSYYTSRTTMVTGLDDDNSVGPFALGFTMKFYWADASTIQIGSNGWVGFSNIGNIAHGFPGIPTAADGKNNFVAPFMADLNLSAAQGPNPGRVYFYTNNVDTAIVSYVNVPFWTRDPLIPVDYTGSNTFQVILTKNDNGVKFQYNNMNPVIPNLTTSNDVVVGIENVTGSIGLQLLLDEIPANNSAYQFYRPANSTLQVIDMKASWGNNPRNGGFFWLKNQPVSITGSVENVGNVDIATTSTVRTRVKAGVAIRNSQNVTVPALPVGQSAAFTQASTYTPVVEGAHRFEHTVTATGDANASNNMIETEFVVLDTTNGKRVVSLSYDDGVPEGITGFATAVYFKPPFYPTEIRTIDAFLLSTNQAVTPANTFLVELFAEDPITGGKGALLFDTLLNRNSIIMNALNTVELPMGQYPILTSGGVYAAWTPVEQPGIDQNVYLAVDETAPFSYRMYEIQAGNLTDFRTASVEDAMINLTISTKVAGISGVSKDRNNLFGVDRMYPNPANSSVTVEYTLKEAAAVEFTISNVIGSKVKTVKVGKQAAGARAEKINVADLKAGVYFCTMKVGDNVVTKRLVVTK